MALVAGAAWRRGCLLLCALAAASASAALPDAPPLGDIAGHDLAIDLGYGIYEGYYNATSGLNIWKGIRYAASPAGRLRWQAPQLPDTDRDVVPATSFGPVCPQTMPSVPGAAFVPGADEDCLFLNVYAPPPVLNSNGTGTKLLPVLVWIHGGGYGMGNGRQDMSAIVTDNNRTFLAVSIQYRLGAFGWLASADVKAGGVVNAGLLDQAFALSWVQDFIAKFGGDAAQVTIAGESAGGGSVMYHALAAGGKLLGPRLFKNGIAASPYLVAQHDYSAATPTRRYYQFAEAAGCHGSTSDVFDCLVDRDTLALQHANFNVSTSQAYGTWAFLPVTDGAYVRGLPSVQLGQKHVNGVNLFVGNNAEEGPLFVPPTIANETDLAAWLQQEFPNLSAANITSVLRAYPATVASSSNAPWTNGTWTNGTAAGTAVPALRRAYDIYAEATFVCPAYWLAAAFTQPADLAKKAAFFYQYSVPYAYHSTDVAAYLGPATTNQGPDFTLAWRRMWGNFITADNPSINEQLASGAASSPPNSSAAAVWAFPPWSDDPAAATLVNLNETGGAPYTTTTAWGASVIQYMGPGLRNNLTRADAYAWEGGRGRRCEFWRDMSPMVPQ